MRETRIKSKSIMIANVSKTVFKNNVHVSLPKTKYVSKVHVAPNVLNSKI